MSAHSIDHRSVFYIIIYLPWYIFSIAVIQISHAASKITFSDTNEENGMFASLGTMMHVHLCVCNTLKQNLTCTIILSIKNYLQRHPWSNVTNFVCKIGIITSGAHFIETVLKKVIWVCLQTISYHLAKTRGQSDTYEPRPHYSPTKWSISALPTWVGCSKNCLIVMLA